VARLSRDDRAVIKATRCARWSCRAIAVLTAAAAVLVTVVGAAPASAAPPPAAQNGVGAFATVPATLVGPSDRISAGQRLGNSLPRPQVVVATGVAANTAAEAAARVGPTTAHGAERIAGAAATRGGVLAEDDILLARAYGQTLTQADGATVRVLQNEASRFNVVVDGDRGLITTFSNLSQKSLERLATRYAWE